MSICRRFFFVSLCLVGFSGFMSDSADAQSRQRRLKKPNISQVQNLLNQTGSGQVVKRVRSVRGVRGLVAYETADGQVGLARDTLTNGPTLEAIGTIPEGYKLGDGTGQNLPAITTKGFVRVHFVDKTREVVSNALLHVSTTAPRIVAPSSVRGLRHDPANLPQPTEHGLIKAAYFWGENHGTSSMSENWAAAEPGERARAAQSKPQLLPIK